MQEEKQARLEQEAERGRGYRIALEIWGAFISAKREDIVNQLELSENVEHLDERLAELRVLRSFGDVARAFVTQGQFAEKELRENG